MLEGVVLPWGEPDGYLRKVILPGLAKAARLRPRHRLGRPAGTRARRAAARRRGRDGGERRHDQRPSPEHEIRGREIGRHGAVGRHPGVGAAPLRRDHLRLAAAGARAVHGRAAVQRLRRPPPAGRSRSPSPWPGATSARWSSCRSPTGSHGCAPFRCARTADRGWIPRSPARSSRKCGERLRFLVDVGLDYLTLNRSAESLSGGEAQRIRLATQIGSRLVGVLYILDEPSIGLHQRDNARLLGTLRAAARSRQHGDRGRARRRDHACRRLPGGPRARRRPARRHDRGRRHRGRSDGQSVVAHRPVPVRRTQHSAARATATGGSEARAAHRERARAQPARARRGHSARHLRRRHRCLGLGQVHAHRGHPASRAGAPLLSHARDPGGARSHSRAASTSTRSSTSTRARSVARRARTRPRTPGSSLPSASCSPRCRRRRSAATAPGDSRST